MATEAEANAQAVRSFFAESEVLVVDQNGGSRAALARSAIAMGAKTQHLTLAADYDTACEAIKKKRPRIILSEYFFGESSALELCKFLRDQGIDTDENLFVILTSNSSQSMIAQAAEEDVDCYILKPHTMESFSDKVQKAVLSKLKPSKYTQQILEGKRFLQAKHLEEAIQAFTKAVSLGTNPSLALFYQGQTEMLKSLLSEAESSYKSGLSFNNIHYKCLIGLFDLLMEKKRYGDAYDVLKTISRVFPTNPNRLAQILRLIIFTKNYDDIDLLYENFKAIENRSAFLVSHVCAALVTCAKHFFRSGDQNRGVDLMKKAAMSARGKTGILKEIVLTLSEYGKIPEAIDALKRFPDNMREEPEYLLSNFILEDRRQKDPKYAILYGKRLIQVGVKDPLIYRSVIRGLAETGKANEALSFIEEAQSLWPDDKEGFSI